MRKRQNTPVTAIIIKSFWSEWGINRTLPWQLYLQFLTWMRNKQNTPVTAILTVSWPRTGLNGGCWLERWLLAWTVVAGLNSGYWLERWLLAWTVGWTSLPVGEWRLLELGTQRPDCRYWQPESHTPSPPCALSANRYTPDCLCTFISLGFCPQIDIHLTISASLSLWVSVHKSIHSWLSLHLYLSGFLSTNRYTPDCLCTFISLGFCPQIGTHLTASAPLSLWVSVHKSIHTWLPLHLYLLWFSVHKSIHTWLPLHLYLLGFLFTNRYTPDCLCTFISLGFYPESRFGLAVRR